jgi:serine/threonine protein kinase
MLAMQYRSDRNCQISRIEYVHSCHLVHSDIKPANLLIGVGKHDNQIYMIDFGVARRYRDPKTHLHILHKATGDLTGTAPYALINNHLGVEQLHHDDLESIIYVLLYFLCGSLPWHDPEPMLKKQRQDTTLEMKMNTSPDILCTMYPVEFSIFLSSTHALHCEDKPDYNYMRNLFRNLFLHEGYHHDRLFAESAMGGNAGGQRSIVGQGTISEQRAEQKNSTQYTSSRMYIAHSSTRCTLLIGACLACVLLTIALNTT